MIIKLQGTQMHMEQNEHQTNESTNSPTLNRSRHQAHHHKPASLILDIGLA